MKLTGRKNNKKLQECGADLLVLENGKWKGKKCFSGAHCIRTQRVI